ncbi:MAG: hypothetical protein QXK37_04275 [Candidatus Woesearchaeota archaeon]
MKINILNSKETKKIKMYLKEQYGFSGKLDYIFLLSSKDKIYLISRDFERIDTEKLNIDTLGLYFATKMPELRISIEGSQIIGPYCKKGIVDIDAINARKWLSGEDVPIESKETGFLLVRHGKDFMGSGKVKDGTLLNFVPKTRRLYASK